MAGKTTKLKFNGEGQGWTQLSEKVHLPDEDAKYAPLNQQTPNNQLNMIKVKKELEKRKHNLELGHGGPIIRQVYDTGDYCEEAKANRKMDVDLRCCTPDEIDHWLKTKKQSPATPHTAVLVSVREESTCVYQSKVCTPMLCPATAKSTTTEASISQKQAADPIGALLDALLPGGVEHGQMQVIFSEEIGPEIVELLRRAENGETFMNHPSFERVKKLLKNGNKSKVFDLKELLKGESFKVPSLEVKEGMSIREILQATLGARPCLQKNAGW